MRRQQCTERLFRKQVKAHKMTVLHDDGMYRHLRFAAPGTGIQYFSLVTFPGYLCYTGDMGSFVFQRHPDMFQLFRSRAPKGRLEINPHYWAEKLDATDIRDGYKQYSNEVFRRAIREWMRDVKAGADLRSVVQGELIDRDFEYESEARQAVEDFKYDGFRFTDFWETKLDEYTHRYIWCCYAITWGIRQYDRNNTKKAVTA